MFSKGTVFGRKFHHVVVETGDGDAAVGIVERSDEGAELVDGIGHRAAVMAGMEVLVGPRHLHFQVGQTAHAAIDGRHLFAYHGGVGDQHHIGLQEILVGLDPGGQGAAANLFLAFEDELDIVPELAGAQQEFEGLDVHEQLALVVVGATAVDSLLTGGWILRYHGLEGVRAPFLQRLRGLYVVMAVYQYRLFGTKVLVTVNYGVTGRFIHPGIIGPGFFQEFRKPLGASVHIGLVLGFGAHGRDTQKGKQLFKEALTVFLDKSFHLCVVSFRYSV